MTTHHAKEQDLPPITRRLLGIASGVDEEDYRRYLEERYGLESGTRTREMEIERVLTLYSQGGISLAAAAERAGISVSDLARIAYSRGMHPSLSSETLSEELGKIA